jgi:ribosomal protein S18 acetylase RimI-like enzyme
VYGKPDKEGIQGYAFHNKGTFLAFITLSELSFFRICMKRATPSQKELVVDILSESFDANKSVNYVVKQDDRRRDRIRGLMEYSFNVCNAFGEVWLSDDDRACALILFPDKKKTTLSSIWWDAKLAISVIGLERVGQVLGRESKIKAFHPKEPFAYLWFVGVMPTSQNKKIGSLLLNELLLRYTKASRPVYLETSVDRNLPWYKKHGFEIFETLQLTYSLFLLRRNLS